MISQNRDSTIQLPIALFKVLGLYRNSINKLPQKGTSSNSFEGSTSLSNGASLRVYEIVLKHSVLTIRYVVLSNVHNFLWLMRGVIISELILERYISWGLVILSFNLDSKAIHTMNEQQLVH